MIRLSVRVAGTAACAFLFGSLLSVAQFPPTAPGPGSAFSISRDQYLQPEELNRLLQAAATKKPLVLQVGSHVLFAEAHIAGSEYIGPGSRPAGLDLLKTRVASLSHDTLIVLYCGCCPWDRCPNIAPAFNTLRQMGFTNVKLLYLPDNFGANWVDKGYPVERGR